MAQRCESCSKEVYRTTYLATSKLWLGTECGCLRVHFMCDADNPFKTSGELTLEHIHDGEGRPLRVTSRRQLEEAEQKYHFNHIPTNMDRNNWDQPRQQRTYTVSDHYQRKFARE